jgi:S-adenosylmethionine-dependent methyltransferase
MRADDMVSPDAVRSAVQRLYDGDAELEWQRAQRHPTEFAITLRALEQHLPPPPCRVLDCGGGPGHYAIELARRGYEVTLFDLSAGNLALAQDRAVEVGAKLVACEQGSAVDLSRYLDGEFDAVLLMGPLYHLLTKEERTAALTEAHRVLKPGGPLFAAFIARYAAHIDAATKFLQEPVDIPGLYELIEEKGLLLPREGQKFVAYFARADEASRACWDAGLEVHALLNVEGLVGGLEHFGLNQLTGAAWEWWLDLNWRMAQEPSLLAAAQHYLVVAYKPLWRTVLASIARRLNAESIPFTVVAGASVALHGVPLVVRDVDIDMSRESIYRFQQLYASRAIKPVSFSESASYRSHFGRFDFSGVQVEAMSDLQWREGNAWQPVSDDTEDMVDVEGTAVRVPWLEEETLAYIRRGRLDRAAFCLRYCDRNRLVALLRGEVKTGAV